MGKKKGIFALMPVSKIDKLFALLRGAKYFTALDLLIGYYHIKLDEEFIPKSTFMTVFGKFEFLRLPFGLSQDLDFFICLINDLIGLNKISSQGQGAGYMAYLDDILIYSRTEKEHLEMLGKAFKCLLKAKLKIKLSKCLFCREQIHYFGLIVSGTSIFPLADKIEALMKLKPPTHVKEVRHFLHLTGHYLKFICNYVAVAYPLNCLTYKAQPFFWTPECQASFDMLHLRLASTPIVWLPDPNKTYLLFTDAIKFCYSGVLTQASTVDSNEALMNILTSKVPLTSIESQTQDLQLSSNVIHPVAYILSSFSQSECSWLAVTKECFSVFMLSILTMECWPTCMPRQQTTTKIFYRTHRQW